MASHELPADLDAPGQARDFLDQLPDLAPAERSDLKLLVTELVTNSLRHAGLKPSDTIMLDVEIGPGLIRTTVRDRGRGLNPADIPKAAGWGLKLVDRLARAWGTRGNAEQQVWFELERAGYSSSSIPS